MRSTILILTILCSAFLQACSSNSPADPAEQSADTSAGNTDNGTSSTDGATEGSSSGSETTDSGEANSDAGMSETDGGMVGEACGTDHPMVGQMATLNTLFHDVAGTIQIVDNCTLEVTDFTYDGGGPDVAFYAYTDGDYFHPEAFRIGPMLHGRAYDNEAITLTLPVGTSLDNFDSLSVWCFQFGISFGEAYFIP